MRVSVCVFRMKSTRYSIHFSFCKPRWGLHQTLLYTRPTYTAYTHNEFSKKYLYDFISKVNFCCFVELLFISPDINNMNISFQASALIIMLEDLNQFSFVRSFVRVRSISKYHHHAHNIPTNVLCAVRLHAIIPKWFLLSHLCIDVEYNLFYHYDD